MINTTKFCPFERIVRCINTLAQNYDSFTVDFGGEIKPINIKTDPKGWNHGLGFSQDARLSFMRKPETTVNVSFIDSDGSVRQTREIIVRHILETDMPLPDYFVDKNGKKQPSNGTNGERDVTYPEARIFVPDSIAPFKLIQKEVTADERRTFADYIGPFMDASKRYIIYGPKLHEKMRAFGQWFGAHNGEKIDGFYLYGADTSAVPDEVVQVVEEVKTTKAKLRRCNIRFNVEGKSHLYVVNQGKCYIDSRQVGFEDLYKVISTAIYAEIHDLGDIEVYASKVGNKLLLGDIVMDNARQDFMTLYYNIIEGDPNVKDVMGSYMSSLDGISINIDKTDIFFLSEKSRACHALSMAYLFALMCDESYTSLFYSLKALVSSKMIQYKKDSDTNRYHFYGNSQAVSDVHGSFDLPTYGGIYSFKGLTRKDYTKLKSIPEDLHTVAILGCDPFSEDHQEGPDHYIVVEVTGQHLSVVYDPYRNYNFFTRGADVSSILEKKNSVLIVYSFDGIEEILNEDTPTEIETLSSEEEG